MNVLNRQAENVSTFHFDETFNSTIKTSINCLEPINFDSGHLLKFNFEKYSAINQCPKCSTDLCKYLDRDFSISYDRILNKINFSKYSDNGKFLFYYWDEYNFSIIWENAKNDTINLDSPLMTENKNFDHFLTGSYSKVIPRRYYTFDLSTHFIISTPQINRF